MQQPAAEGLAVLYVLCRDWMAERDQLAALGVKDPDRLDSLLGLDGSGLAAPKADRAQRRLQVATMGGEIA